MASTINTVLTILLGVDAALLILVVLMQNRSTGLSATFGGSSFVSVKRGPEKFLARLTAVLAAVFMILALVVPLWQPILAMLSSRFGIGA